MSYSVSVVGGLWVSAFHRESHLKTVLYIAGCVASCIAIVTMLDGHWLVLQSVEWIRMQEEQQHKKILPIETEETMDVLVAIQRPLVFPMPVNVTDVVPFAPHLHTGFLEPPPTPPPREFTEVS